MVDNTQITWAEIITLITKGKDVNIDVNNVNTYI